MPVGQSNQQKTHTMVVMYLEDGEKALNVERPRSRGNSKKSSLKGLTSNDEATYTTACRAPSNDGQIYIAVGKLNGRKVKVL